MRTRFVITENVSKTVAALEPFLAALEKGLAPATDRGMVLLEGRTGTGKTWTCDWLAVQNHRFAVCLRSERTWTPPWMMRDFSLALRLPVRQSTEANLRQIREELRRRPRLLILDEGDRVLKKEKLLETLRDLYDTVKSPVLIVSEGGGLGLLERQSPRFWRRTGQVVAYASLTAADIQILWSDLAEVTAPLSKSQAQQILELSGGGSFGEVMVNLEELEQLLRNNPGQGLSDKMVSKALRARKAA